MALALGNKSSNAGYLSTSLTHSHTVDADSNALLVSVSAADDTGTPSITVTYNGVAMVLVTQTTHTWEDVYWFWLPSPATGANDVVVSVSGGTANACVAAYDYAGHDGNTPASGYGATSSSSTTVTTGSISETSGDVVLAAVASPTSGSTHTWTNAVEDYQLSQSWFSAAFATRSSTGGSVTITATASVNIDRFVIDAIKLSPVSGPVVTADTDGEVDIGEAGLPSPINPTTETFTASPAFGSAINAGSLDGVTATSLLSGLSTSAATLTAPDIDDFRPGGAFNAVPIGAAVDLELTDGTDTAVVPVTLQPGVPGRFGTITNLGSNAPAGAVIGEKRMCVWLAGEGSFNAATGAATASVFESGVATYAELVYHDGAWIEGTVVPFSEPASGGGALPGKLTMGRLAIGV